jgi:hypothetical protein
MRAVALTALAAVAVLAAGVQSAAAASGGGAPTFREHVTSDSGTDTNFCGTGKTITYEGRNRASVWIGETGGDPDQDLKIVFNSRYVLTNPATGAAVVDESAGLIENRIVAGQESGAHTHRYVENGIRAKLKLANGGLLTRDAGSLVYTISFDAADKVTDVTVIADHGSHPAFYEDVWCATAVEALGL